MGILSCVPSVVSGGLLGLIVAIGFQVMPDICCDDDPTVFHVHEVLAMIVLILLILSLCGFLHYSVRKSSKLRFMLRFKSVVAIGGLTMFIPVLGITSGARVLSHYASPAWLVLSVGESGVCLLRYTIHQSSAPKPPIQLSISPSHPNQIFI